MYLLPSFSLILLFYFFILYVFILYIFFDGYNAPRPIPFGITDYENLSNIFGIVSAYQDRYCFVLVWFGLVWFGLVWFGLVWFGLVWFGLVWFGLVWFGLVWFGLLFYLIYCIRPTALYLKQLQMLVDTILEHQINKTSQSPDVLIVIWFFLKLTW